MSAKTAVGGFDSGGDWLAILAALVSLGFLPKSFRPTIGTASTVLLVFKLGRNLGWW